MVRVHVTDGYYEHEQFDLVPQTWWSKDDLYDVPREQVDRWEAAQGAWAGAQQEMAALMKERSDRRIAEQSARQQREDARRAEIRAGLYGGRKR
jgi:hypothetical protein